MIETIHFFNTTGVVDPVKLGVLVANKETAILHSLLHSPIDVLTPDDRQTVIAALSEQTPEQQQAAVIAEGLGNLVTMVEKALQ